MNTHQQTTRRARETRILFFSAAAAFAFAACALDASAAPGLAVSATAPYVNYVVDEDIVVTFTVSNIGNTMYIIDDYPPYNQNSVALVVRDPRGRLMLPRPDAAPIVAECSIRPGESAKFEVVANHIFDFKEEGRYMLSIEALRGDDGAASRMLPFTLVPGINIGTASRPAPGFDNRALAYQLIYWARNEKEHLFLRVKDSETGATRGFAALGPVVRFAEPKIEFEPDGTVVVTHQSDRDKFVRTRLATKSSDAISVSAVEPMTSVVSLQEAEAVRAANRKIAEFDAAEKKNPKPFVKPPRAAPPEKKPLGPIKKK